jgi:hypothetical protein
MKELLTVTAIVAWSMSCLPAVAQHSRHHNPNSPYVGLEARAIKALSAREINDLRSGQGMGLALAAELNGYPGPLHVLEHADALALTVIQRSKLQSLVAEMRASAKALGERVIATEAELDHQFATGRANLAQIDATTSEIARLRGELRASHLRYHLETLHLLDRSQVERYRELRGYAQSHRRAQSHH